MLLAGVVGIEPTSGALETLDKMLTTLDFRAFVKVYFIFTQLFTQLCVFFARKILFTFYYKIEQFFLSYEVAETIRDERAQDYKTFLKLTQSLSYAESPNFVYGPFALEKEQIQIIEKEERDIER